MKTSKQNDAFTLIELLVVIAIISLLSSVVLASLSGARESAKVTRTASDLEQIEVAMTMWMQDKGRVQYPVESNFSLSDLVTDGYLSSLPKPLFGDSYGYDYDNDSFSCGSGAEYQGVNFVVNNISSTNQDIISKVNKIIENDTDGNGNQDLECGKLKSNGSSNILYSPSKDGMF